INCDAVTPQGDISSVTTTSGLAFKIPGRVGDSPIIGAGQYTDNDIGAAGSTGRGESNIKVCGGFLTVEFMRRGMKPTDACLETLKRVVQLTEPRLLGPGGKPTFDLKFYAVNQRGEVGAASLNPASSVGVVERPEPTVAWIDLGAGARTVGSYALVVDAQAPAWGAGWRAGLAFGAVRVNRLGYYGLGNDTQYSRDSLTTAGSYFYKVSRTTQFARATVQRRVIGPLRILAGEIGRASCRERGERGVGGGAGATREQRCGR